MPTASSSARFGETAALLAWFAILVSGCAKAEVSPQVGTNTNWLQSCSSNDDCSQGNACLCGMCTVSCEGPGECSAFGAHASCAPLEASACGSGVSGQSACLATCESDRDCDALADRRCADGACVPRSDRDGGSGGSGGGSGGAAGAGGAGRGGMLDSGVDADMPDASPLELVREFGTVIVTDAYRACEEHSDCELVSTSCDGCCQRDAVSTSLRATYDERYPPACADYMGGICSCTFLDVIARCEDRRCQAVLRADTGCFAPELNEDRANDVGAEGCPCESDHRVCTATGAFVCSNRAGAQSWQTVADGLCEEPFPDPFCETSAAYPTVEMCILYFHNCYRIASGEYCGARPHSVCDNLDKASCDGLAEECQSLSARELGGENDEPVFIACVPAECADGDVMTCASDNLGGPTYAFPTACVPPHWSVVSCD